MFTGKPQNTTVCKVSSHGTGTVMIGTMYHILLDSFWNCCLQAELLCYKLINYGSHNTFILFMYLFASVNSLQDFHQDKSEDG